MSKINPTGNRVLVQVDEDGESNIGGIVVPNMRNTPRKYGTVIAVGPGTESATGFTKVAIKTGQRVLANVYGDELDRSRNAPRQYIIEEGDIVATFED